MKKISRHEFITLSGTTAAFFTIVPAFTRSIQPMTIHTKMYGLIGNITAKTGRRDELIRILLDGTTDMPGCLSYIISKDTDDEDIIWVTEVWDSKESHQASLSLPTVQEAINQGRPLIAEFGERVEMEPVGGHGMGPTETQ
jgi:quinol monooxygenase YgiN